MTERYLTVRVVGRVELGPMLPSERNYVLSSWTEGLVDGSPYWAMAEALRGLGWGAALKPHRRAWTAYLRPEVEAAFQDPATRIDVARDADTPALAYGWCAWQDDPRAGPGVLWVAVKPAFRRLGIAHALVPPGARWHAYSSQHNGLARAHGLMLRTREPSRRSA